MKCLYCDEECVYGTGSDWASSISGSEMHPCCEGPPRHNRCQAKAYACGTAFQMGRTGIIEPEFVVYAAFMDGLNKQRERKNGAEQ